MEKSGKLTYFFVQVNLPNRKLLVGEIYRIPNTSEKLSIDRYGKVIDTLTNSYPTHNIIIGTDQNFDYMKINNNNNISLLFDTFCSAGLIPVIDKPTRITHSSATCIDNIYVKCSPYELSNAISGIIETDISDSHMPVFLFTGQKEKHSSTKGPLRFTCRPINEANIKCIVNDLQNHDWSMLQDMTVDIAYDYLLDKLLEITNIHAPEKNVVIPSKQVKHEAWMSSGIMKSAKMRDHLYKKCIGTPKTHSNYVKFIQYRNIYNKLKRIAKQLYYKELLEQYQNDIKRTWDTLNKITGRTRNKISIPDSFKIDGKKVTDNKQIAESFCAFFAEIGQIYANKIPHTNKSVRDFLTGPSNPNSIFLNPCTMVEIEQLINNSKSKTSRGHDGLSMLFIKQIKSGILLPLTHIINTSMTTGKVPTKMKYAKVIPVYKSKDKQSLSNYRPISLLPNLSKILEKVMHKRVYEFLQRYDYKDTISYTIPSMVSDPNIVQ